MAKEKVIPNEYGFIFYTDGGAAPTNPGPAGIGLHGYQFTKVTPKKGSGNPNFVLTNKGYVDKKEVSASDIIVTPIQYFDGHGSFNQYRTNNYAELQAAIASLKFTRECPIESGASITSVTILADSRYVVDGVNKGIRNWKRNEWRKSNDAPIANEELWRELDQEIQFLTNAGVSVIFNWVKAHTDDLDGETDIIGNILADRLATIGTIRSLRGFNRTDSETQVTINTSPADTYWKKEIDRNPLISQKGMLFNTCHSNTNTGIYFLCDNTSETELIGKRISDGAFSVVILNEPETILELILKYYEDNKPELDSIIFLKLDRLYKPINYNEITAYGENALVVNSKRNVNDLYTVDDEILTKDLFPPLIANRAIVELEQLYSRLIEVVGQSEDYVYTDITSLIYESVEKKVKKEVITEFVLRPEYKPGIPCLTVKVNYSDGDTVSVAPIALTFTIDLPDRNTFKRLEEHNPKVFIITWNIAPGIFKYATLIQADVGVGIWAGVYSNTHFIKPKRG